MRLLLAFIALCLLYLTISTDGAVVRTNDAFPHDAIVRQRGSKIADAIEKVKEFFADKLKDKDGSILRKGMEILLENLDKIPLDDDDNRNGGPKNPGNPAEDPDSPNNPFGIDPNPEGPPPDDDDSDSNEDKGNEPEDPDSPNNPFGIDPNPEGPPPDDDDSDSNEGKGNEPEDPDNPSNGFGIDPPSPDEGNSRDDDNGGGQDDSGGCCSDNDLPDSF